MQADFNTDCINPPHSSPCNKLFTHFSKLSGIRSDHSTVANSHNFTNKAWDAVLSAGNVAEKMNHQTVKTGYLMKALLEPRYGRARRIFAKTGVDFKLVLGYADDYLQRQVLSATSPSRDPNLECLIKRAKKYMKEYDDLFISVEHLLLAFRQDKLFGKQLFAKFQLSEGTLKEAVREVRGQRTVIDRDPEGKYNVIHNYGRDLTALAKAKKLDPVVGRADEVNICIQILLRRTMGNLILVGDPGVGKTAIVEGLAQRIVDGNVPEDLLNCKLISLDMGALVAGGKVRGEFESRLTAVIKEVVDSSGEIIIFIDEIHTIVGAGAAMGSMDASNLLKPVLGRGEIRCIGATTSDEYNKYFEKDKALARRFEKVTIEEPNVNDTISILHGVRKQLEVHHGVRISDNALTEAAILSDRYITDRRLPGKAYALIDEAAAKLKTEITSTRTVPNEIDEAIKELEKERECLENKTDHISIDRLPFVAERLVLLKQRQCVYGIVTEHVIAEIVSKRTGIPVSKLLNTEREVLLQLDEELHKRIVGQNVAVRAVAASIKRFRIGISDPRRPIATYLFAGPTGVGKTELAKAVAACVFNSEKDLIRVDMSEYMEKHAVSRLLGAPPGYVGHENRGQLTELVRKNPYSPILLDEIEKAHPDVLNVLLQILDDGILTDSHGVPVSFKNTLIMMTSNVGSKFILGTKDDDYETMKKAVMVEAESTFRPEFLNRTEIIVFEPLDHDQNISIAKIQLERLNDRMARKKMKIQMSDAAVQHIVTVGFDSKYGARPLKRAIEKYVEEEITDRIIKGDFKDGDTISVDVGSFGESPVEKLVFTTLDGSSGNI